MAMSSSMRWRRGLTEDWIDGWDIGVFSRDEGQPLMLGPATGPSQRFIALYVATYPARSAAPARAGSCRVGERTSRLPLHSAPIV